MVASFRERILQVYRGERVGETVWQPRIRFWYTGNHVHVQKARQEHPLHDTTIPDSFFGMDLLEVHEALNASIRYPAETLGIGCFGTTLQRDEKVRVTGRTEPDGTHVTVTETPAGTVTERSRGGYTTEHAIKTPEDIPVIEYLLDRTTFTFNEPGFNLAEEVLGDMGITQSYYMRSPFMRCVLNYIGFETSVIMLKRHRPAILDFMKFLSEWDDAMYDTIVACPMQVLNFGENIDGNLVSPRFFKDFCIPYYNKRIDQVHDAGKFCHVHMDGSLKDLLPLVKETRFDGVEAATPVPQGDVTVQEIKDGLGDKVLLDGIPATLFMKQFPVAALEATTREIIELFGDRLILGVSDELPPNGEIGRFAAVRKVIEAAARS